MKNISHKTRKYNRAFSLAEVIAALIIGAMVLTAVLGIYGRIEASAAAITNRLDSSQLPYEVLQHIAEDIDRVATPGFGTKIVVENKFERGYSTARLTILKTIYDKKNKEQTFEEIVWQTSYDNDANGLVLYRSHKGIGLEDKLLDEKKEKWERELFVPVCTGVTFFKVQAYTGETPQDKWTSNSPPYGVIATISFAEPFKTAAGTLDVVDSEKNVRTIAIDRTRKIKFIIVKKVYNKNKEQTKDSVEDELNSEIKQGDEEPNSK